MKLHFVSPAGLALKVQREKLHLPSYCRASKCRASSPTPMAPSPLHPGHLCSSARCGRAQLRDESQVGGSTHCSQAQTSAPTHPSWAQLI